MTPSIGIMASSHLVNVNFIATLSGTPSLQTQFVGTDSTNNIYSTGYDGTTQAAIIYKRSSAGSLLWQRSLLQNSTYNYGGFVDSSGNIHGVGYVTPSAINIAMIFKYNSSGTIQWQRSLNQGTYSSSVGGCGGDSSSNVFMGVRMTTTGSDAYAVLAKYNSSGAIQWQRQIFDSTSTTNNFSGRISSDSSGNIYVGGFVNPSGNYTAILTKYNSSGVFQWIRKLRYSANLTVGNGGTAVDSAGNVYLHGRYNNGTDSDLFLAKYNSSGTIQWQRVLGSVSNDTGTSIAIDSSDNIYISGYGAASTSIWIVAKYNSSGTIQWQRTVTCGAAISQANFVSIDGLGNMIVSGYTGTSPTQAAIVKLPTDGSKTGTYSVNGISFVYAASTLTDAAGSLTDSAYTVTESAGTYTDAASSATDAATSYTSTVTTI